MRNRKKNKGLSTAKNTEENLGRKRIIANRIWVERKEWADRKEEAALDAMKKEGLTKAAKRAKARKEKAGAAASRK